MADFVEDVEAADFIGLSCQGKTVTVPITKFGHSVAANTHTSWTVAGFVSAVGIEPNPEKYNDEGTHGSESSNEHTGA